MEHSLIIISDLHVGINDDFDIFAAPNSDKHAVFTRFLTYARQQPNPIELVINGDFIDFLQLRPWNDLSRDTAQKKIKEIVLKSPSVFKDLGTFLSEPRHRLRILPGNHDVELAYPEVGQILRDAILQSAPDAKDRLDLFGPPDSMKQTYRPTINGVMIQIEHGNEGDPFNSLVYQTLFNDAETGSKNFSYPPGTTLVYDIMNNFKETLRFVDLLKPEMPSVILILMAMKPYMSLLGLPGIALKLVETAGNSIVTMIKRKIVGLPMGPKPAEGMPASDADHLETFLARTFLEEESPSDFEMEVFLSAEEVPGSTDPTMGPKLTRVRFWLLSWALQVLARFQAVRQGAEFLNVDHPGDAAAKGAEKRFTDQVKVVVFGHTHEVLKTEFTKGLYVNSGAWADMIALPQDGREAILQWLDDVAANRFKRTAYPTYVKIEPASKGVTVSLNLWDDNKEQLLWAKNI